MNKNIGKLNEKQIENVIEIGKSFNYSLDTIIDDIKESNWVKLNFKKHFLRFKLSYCRNHCQNEEWKVELEHMEECDYHSSSYEDDENELQFIKKLVDKNLWIHFDINTYKTTLDNHTIKNVVDMLNELFYNKLKICVESVDEKDDTFTLNYYNPHYLSNPFNILTKLDDSIINIVEKLKLELTNMTKIYPKKWVEVLDFKKDREAQFLKIEKW